MFAFQKKGKAVEKVTTKIVRRLISGSDKVDLLLQISY